MKDKTWNSKKDFLNEYIPLLQKVDNGDANSYSKIKDLRIKVFHNTVELVNTGFYYSEDNERIEFDDIEEMSIGTRFYENSFEVQNIIQNTELTTIEVVNADCMYEGIRLLNLGYNPAILNMASRHNPGGGVTTGAGAQEETIFRRTNIFRSLYQFAPYAEQYNVKQSKLQYPMDKNFGGIYSPKVTIFREDERNGYKLINHPKKLAFISVAGVNRPSLNRNGMIEDFVVEQIKNKMRTILRIGLIHSHDALVLGALGCGAFRNPPKHIACLFDEVIKEKEFANKYKYIVFAILEDHNSYKRHNLEGNYLPFKQKFEI